jgi:hypothetical protein
MADMDNQALENEVQELRRRILDLEVKLATQDVGNQGTGKAPHRARVRDRSRERDQAGDRERRDDASRTVREFSDRSLDETSRFLRGGTYAYLEGVRLFANVLSSFADSVMSRNRRRDKDDPDREPLSYLVDDAVAASDDVRDEYFEIPRKVVDKLDEVYRED